MCRRFLYTQCRSDEGIYNRYPSTQFHHILCDIPIIYFRGCEKHQDRLSGERKKVASYSHKRAGEKWFRTTWFCLTDWQPDRRHPDLCYISQEHRCHRHGYERRLAGLADWRLMLLSARVVGSGLLCWHESVSRHCIDQSSLFYKGRVGGAVS